MNNFQPLHFLGVDDFTNEQYLEIFAAARQIKEQWDSAENEVLLGKKGIVSLLFTEPSTRTSMSFDKAAQLLGWRTASLNINASSIAKGESYNDTTAMAALRSNVLVARHGGEKGTLRHLADEVFPRHKQLSRVSIINAGEGTGEHPTQALLDLFTIQEHFGRADVRISFYGDLKYGRTSHSLIKLGARFGAEFTCIAPTSELQMPDEYLDYAAQYGKRPICTNNIKEAIGDIDVLYVVRLQRERMPQRSRLRKVLTQIVDKIGLHHSAEKPGLPHKLHHSYDEKLSGYGVTRELLDLLPKKSILMHPLPRLDELPTYCDLDPRSMYIEQADNGIITRVALLNYIMESNRKQMLAL